MLRSSPNHRGLTITRVGFFAHIVGKIYRRRGTCTSSFPENTSLHILICVIQAAV